MSSETTSPAPTPSRRGERFAMIGTVVSALAASSCCWVPLLLLVLAATGLTSASLAGDVFVKMSAFIEAYRWPLIVVTFAFLGLAFYLVYRPRPAAAEGCEAPCWPSTGKSGGRRFNMMTMNKVMLWVVAMMAIVFLFFPQHIVALVMPGESRELTADMTQTVFRVSTGLTWVNCEAAAERAVVKAPGVLAAKADYAKQTITVGTKKGEPVPRQKVLAALQDIGYQAEPAEPVPE